MEEFSEQLKAILDAVPFGVVFVDSTGYIVTANGQVMTQFGYDSKELIGQELSILLPEGLRSIHTNLFANFIAKPTTRTMGKNLDLVGRHKDGMEFPIEVGLGWMTYGDSGLAMAFITDVSEQRNIVTALQQDLMQHRIQSLDDLSTNKSTAITSHTYGMLPLKQSAPSTHTVLVEEYAQLLDLALEQKAKKVKHDLSPKLRDIADQLGYLRSGPRDVVELHASAVRNRLAQCTLQKAHAYLEEGNILALELMGYLVSYYRIAPR